MILPPPPSPIQQVASVKPQCIHFVQPLTPAVRRSEAARISAKSNMATTPENVHLIMADAGWRLVWATPDDKEEGVWFLKRASKGYRIFDIWGGVISDAADEAGVVRWQTRRGVPLPLARCFASIGGAIL